MAPHPLPPCLLEVLILEGLQANVLEVLILVDLLSRLLILMDFKSFIIIDLIKNEDFAEVLILEGLQSAFSEVLILRVLRANNSNGLRAYMNELSRWV